VLVIGDEVLSGKTADTNSAFLIRALRERGIGVIEVRVIGDTLDGIATAAYDLAARVTHLFTTGGIGPTHDDMTLPAIAQAFAVGLVESPIVVERLRRKHPERLNAAAFKMAQVPDGAVVTLSGDSIVPVIRFRNIFIFPGVPSLMRACFEEVAPTLAGPPFVSRALYLNAYETQFAQTLERSQRSHPEVAIGSYPRLGDRTYKVKVTVDGRDQALVDAVMAELEAALDPAWIVRGVE
jgi:molybdenum cofactor synthesis domain-containing protein